MSCASVGLLGAHKAAVFSPSTCSPTWKSSASASTASLQAGGLLFYGLLQYAAGASRQTQRKSVAIRLQRPTHRPGFKAWIQAAPSRCAP